MNQRETTERAVIGMALRRMDGVLERAIEMGITADWFWKPNYGQVWQLILDVHKAGRAVDIIEIGVRLNEMPHESLPPHAIVEMADEAPVAQNADAWLEEFRLLRWRGMACALLDDVRTTLQLREPFKTDDDAIISATFKKLSASLQGTDGDPIPLSVICERLVGILEARETNRSAGATRGTVSGFKQLDQILGGFVPGRMYVLAARPSVGKTTMLVNFAKAAADAGAPWIFFTLEMAPDDIGEKILSLSGEIIGARLQTGDLTEREVDKISVGLKSMSRMNGYVDGRAGRYIETFEASVRRAVRRDGIKVVFLDYLQQMRVKVGRFQSRQAELTEITDRIKQLALTQDIAIVTAAQLSRETERVGAPLMSHLKESGSIEQDADAVLFIHRDAPDAPVKLIVAKNRWGRKGWLALKADLAINQFQESGVSGD